jgi:hypothetical protein
MADQILLEIITVGSFGSVSNLQVTGCNGGSDF